MNIQHILNRPGRTTLAVLAWAVLAACLHAQPVELTEPLPEQRPPDVYINDSFEANELLARARKLARGRSWAEAVEVAAELMQDHSDKLVADGERRFVSMPQAIGALVADWPADGRAALVRRFGPVIDKAMAAAIADHDLDAMLTLWAQYGWSDQRLDIARKAADFAIEAGAFSEADKVLTALRNNPLDNPADRSAIHDATMRLAVVYALEGRQREAEELAASVSDGGGRLFDWGGVSTQPMSVIKDVAHTFAPSAPSAGFEWPVFGGNPARTARVDRSVDEFALLWYFEGLTPELHEKERDDDRSGGYERAMEGGHFLFYHPVVANGLVYVQDHARVWAIDVTTGRVVWSYEHRPPNRQDGSTPEVAGARWFSVTVDGDRLFACFGGEPAVYYGEAAGNDSEMVCLDARSGERIWLTTPPGDVDKTASMRFDGAPLATGHKLFTVVRRQRSFGFEDCYLCRLDAGTGELEFQTHLGSGSAGGYGFRLATMSLPAICNGDVFVATNLGTIASVSTHTGMVNWLRIYDRSSPGDSRNQDASRFKPWQRNPVLCDGGRVIAAPVDAGELFMLDMQSGLPIHAVPIGELKDVDTVVGVRGTTLFGLGTEVFAYDLAGSTMLWSAAVPTDDPIRGRATLVGDRLLVPGRASLRSYDLLDGTVKTQAWDSEIGGGNLLAMPGQLIVAGHDKIAAYARKQDVWQRLTDRLNDAPSSIGAALDLADLALRSGDQKEGSAYFEEALRRADNATDDIPESIARRLFETGMSYAQRSAHSGDVESNEAIDYLTECERWAPTTADHVRLRLEMADEWIRRNQPDEAVAMYQRLLGDRSLRSQRWPTDNPAGRTAGELAVGRLNDLIAAHGREVYAPYEEEAKRYLKASLEADNLALLDRVLEEYPSADVWKTALHERGRMLRRLGRPLEAARDLYRVYADRADRAAAPELVREIVEAYIEADRTPAAWQWLCKGALDFPEIRLSRGDKQVTFAQWRDEVAEHVGGVRPSRPEISLPLSSRFTRTFDAPITLLDAPDDQTGETGRNIALVFTDEALTAVNPRTGRDLWPLPVACDLQPTLLSAGHDRLLLHTRFSLFALNPADGTRLWTVGETPVGWTAPDADWEGLQAIHAVAVGRRHAVILREGGQLSCIALATGKTEWTARVSGGDRICVGEDQVVVSAEQHGVRLFTVFDLESGKDVESIAHADDQQILALAMALDGTLVVTTSNSLYAYDTQSGRLLWSSKRYQGLSHERVVPDVDGIYVCDRNEGVDKLSWNSGAVLWHVDVRPLWKSRQLVMHRVQNRLLMESDATLYGIDAVDGRLLWDQPRGDEIPVGPLLLTQELGFSIEPARDGTTGLKAYAHRVTDGLGEIAEGGTIDLDGIEQFDRSTVRHGALLLSRDRTLEGFIEASP